MKRIALAVLALLSLAAPALAREPLACIAPTEPADAGKPLAEVKALEFYADEGDPLKAFSRQFVLQGSASDAEGRTLNRYSVGPEGSDGTIVFAEGTPVSFGIAETKKSFVSLKKNDEETTSMSDAVPGVVCYTVGLADAP